MRRWTEDTDREADALYRTFSYAKIRRYQDLAEQQMAMAYRKREQYDMTDALADLNAMHDALARELRRRLDEGGDVGQRRTRRKQGAVS